MWHAELEILHVGLLTASACAQEHGWAVSAESGLSGQSAGVCGGFGWLESSGLCVTQAHAGGSNPCGGTFSAPGCGKHHSFLVGVK